MSPKNIKNMIVTILALVDFLRAIRVHSFIQKVRECREASRWCLCGKHVVQKIERTQRRIACTKTAVYIHFQTHTIPTVVLIIRITETAPICRNKINCHRI